MRIRKDPSSYGPRGGAEAQRMIDAKNVTYAKRTLPQRVYHAVPQFLGRSTQQNRLAENRRILAAERHHARNKSPQLDVTGRGMFTSPIVVDRTPPRPTREEHGAASFELGVAIRGLREIKHEVHQGGGDAEKAGKYFGGFASTARKVATGADITAKSAEVATIVAPNPITSPITASIAATAETVKVVSESVNLGATPMAIGAHGKSELDYKKRAKAHEPGSSLHTFNESSAREQRAHVINHAAYLGEGARDMVLGELFGDLADAVSQTTGTPGDETFEHMHRKAQANIRSERATQKAANHQHHQDKNEAAAKRIQSAIRGGVVSTEEKAQRQRLRDLGLPLLQKHAARVGQESLAAKKIQGQVREQLRSKRVAALRGHAESVGKSELEAKAEAKDIRDQFTSTSGGQTLGSRFNEAVFGSKSTHTKIRESLDKAVGASSPAERAKHLAHAQSQAQSWSVKRGTFRKSHMESKRNSSVEILKSKISSSKHL